ncbi:MAG: hypothetical protein K2L07_13895 [Lachnospiraceae bacterium]|nr:hypothetical protein [Lachnospiraceae bacterium]
MTVPVSLMIIIGIIFIFASYFFSENFSKKDEYFNADLLTVKGDYEFSERERQIIKRKIEDVIAEHAKEILYETNESLANMANEKTMALGDYAVTVCDEIERNHKEVMFLYSMLDDKQKEIMKTVQAVDKAKQELKDSVMKIQVERKQRQEILSGTESPKRQSAIDQLTALKQMKEQLDARANQNHPVEKEVTAKKIADMPAKNVQVFEKVPVNTEVNAIEPSKTVVNEKKTRIADSAKDTLEDAVQDDLSLDLENSDVLGQEYDMEIENAFEEEDLSDYEDVFEQVDQTDTLDEEFEENVNLNDTILRLHERGHNIISIARELGLGVGEVKLVIDLYQGV